MKVKLAEVLKGLTAAMTVLPFVENTIAIVKSAIDAGRESVTIEEILNGWQMSLDKVDAEGRKWLEDHGFELPPPKPTPV